MNIREFAVETVVIVGQFIKIEAENVENGGVEFPDICDLFHAASSEFVSRSVDITPADPAAG